MCRTETATGDDDHDHVDDGEDYDADNDDDADVVCFWPCDRVAWARAVTVVRAFRPIPVR